MLASTAAAEAVVACVGGGSNAIGILASSTMRGAARPGSGGQGGVARRASPPSSHGLLLGARRRGGGQIADAHSISRPRLSDVGPEHAFLRDTGRAEYRVATDEEALAAFQELARTEGILPALEPAHALARARDLDAELILVGLSGRGDKDLAEVLERL
jgi:tryptophan synthase beta chain